jgi:hypothetical protein
MVGASVQQGRGETGKACPRLKAVKLMASSDLRNEQEARLRQMAEDYGKFMQIDRGISLP